MMLDKLKDKLPGMGKKKAEEKAPSIEIEMEDEEEMPPEGEEGEEEEVEVGALAKFSDEELKAEMEKRGMEVASGGSSIMALPELPEEEEEGMPMPEEEEGMVPKKKPKKAYA